MRGCFRGGQYEAADCALVSWVLEKWGKKKKAGEDTCQGPQKCVGTRCIYFYTCSYFVQLLHKYITSTSHIIRGTKKYKYKVHYIYLYTTDLLLCCLSFVQYLYIQIQIITKHTPGLSPSPPAASIAGFAAYR